MIVCGFVVPQGAEILGLHAAGALWNAFRASWPWLTTAGILLAGVIGGAIVGLAQWAIAPAAPPRWIAVTMVAAFLVAVAHAVYTPATVLVAPVAGAVSALSYSKDGRWVRAQALAAAWVALALMLPFPQWTRAVLIVAAAILSGWGLRATASRAFAPVRVLRRGA